MIGQGSQHRRYSRRQLQPRKWVAVQGGGRTSVWRCPLMGLGGLFLECSDPLSEGSVVRFAFQLGCDTIRGTASVRDTTARGMGMAFLSLRIADRSKIHSFLRRLS